MCFLDLHYLDSQGVMHADIDEHNGLPAEDKLYYDDPKLRSQ